MRAPRSGDLAAIFQFYYIGLQCNRYFDQESSDLVLQSIEGVLIIGAGWVGRQIAGRIARFGGRVWMVDRNPEAARKALDWLQRTHLAGAVEKDAAVEPDSSNSKWLENIELLESVTHVSNLTSTPQLAIECVSEQLSLKKRVLREVSQALAKQV